MSSATLPPPTGPMSADDFLRLHGDESGIELIDGRIVRLPMPGLEHGEVCLNVGAIIREHVKAHRLGRVFSNDSFVRLSADRVRGPDVLFIGYKTLSADVPTPKGAFAPPLELVVEVRSPFNSIREMTMKADEYLDAGVKVVLVVEPESASVGVFRSDELPQRFHNGDVLELPDVLPGFSVQVKRFFE